MKINGSRATAEGGMYLPKDSPFQMRETQRDQSRLCRKSSRCSAIRRQVMYFLPKRTGYRLRSLPDCSLLHTHELDDLAPNRLKLILCCQVNAVSFGVE